jgi:hypothetical protein
LGRVEKGLCDKMNGKELKMSNQNSKNTGMNQTKTTSVNSLWENKPANASGLGLTAADLNNVTREIVQSQSSDLKARIKTFEVSVNRESLNRVFKSEDNCIQQKS